MLYENLKGLGRSVLPHERTEVSFYVHRYILECPMFLKAFAKLLNAETGLWLPCSLMQ